MWQPGMLIALIYVIEVDVDVDVIEDDSTNHLNTSWHKQSSQTLKREKKGERTNEEITWNFARNADSAFNIQFRLDDLARQCRIWESMARR